MKTTDFSFHLPENLIAQTPLGRRDSSRMLCLDRACGEIKHSNFYNIANILKKGDLLVLNDSRVLPARLLGQKVPSGGAVEFLLLEQTAFDSWQVLVRPGGKVKKGATISFGDGLLTALVIEVLENGNRLVKFSWEGDFFEVIEKIGKMPLPHYITTPLTDNERYQTVYCRERGSAAAPTAGLHFTDDTFKALEEKGVDTAFVTLHVGVGTFRPIKASDIADHKMHSEWYTISDDVAQKIKNTKQAGGRVIAVGTTSCRTIESAANTFGEVISCHRETDIFIKPGYKFKVIDGLITNFHLPQSTLLILVCAFAGIENTLNAYNTAVKEGYRFYSFGDCMAIL